MADGRASHFDREAFWADWIQTNGDRLLLFTRSQTRRLTESEDILQEALLRVWRHWEKGILDGESLLPAAYTNIRRLAIDNARKNQRREKRESVDFLGQQDQESINSEWFQASQDSIDQEELHNITEVLEQIPNQYREVIILRIWSDLTHRQIADILNLSINSVASLYRYGLKLVRKELEKRQMTTR